MRHRVSFAINRHHRCGCTDVYAFWFFGYDKRLQWGICVPHLREKFGLDQEKVDE